MIKFRNSEKTYDVEVSIIEWRSVIQLSGKELPTEFSDFDVLNDEEVVVDYFEGFNVVYDSGDGYVQLTNDNNTYYNYFVYDENNYVVSTNVSAVSRDDAYLYQSGQGKMYKHFSMNLTNDDGFPLYKIEDNKLFETSEDERNVYHEEKLKEQVNIAKANKIFECNNICNQMIVKGIDVEINGVVEHFGYKEEDQMNIKELFDLSGQTNVPMYYHADGGNCKAYTTEQIISIYATACANKNHHTTYFNQLRQYINSLETLEEIEAVVYGQELPNEYVETYNGAMAQAQLVLETLLAQRASILGNN